MRVEDVYQAILDESPQIVHFCSHGTAKGLILHCKNGGIQQVTTEELTGLFKLFKVCIAANSIRRGKRIFTLIEMLPKRSDPF